MNLPAALVFSSFALGLGGVSSYLAFGPERPAQAAESDSVSAPDAEVAALRSQIAELQATVAGMHDGTMGNNVTRGRTPIRYAHTSCRFLRFS